MPSMKQKPKLLLTGDDGYNSYGTRILIHCLKDQYDLTVVGTFTQQSGVGGKLSLADGFDWGHTTVDGIPAIWVAGTPADAMELAAEYFGRTFPFDLVISGINWGVNMGTAVYGSGTVNAAMRALSSNLAHKAMAVSWDIPGDHWTEMHESEKSISEYLAYPGGAIRPLLDLATKQQFWGAELLNVNFPNQPTKKIKMTRFVMESAKVYTKARPIEKAGGHYTYTGQRVQNPEIAPDFDAQALSDGWISISVCNTDLTDLVQYKKHQNAELELE